MICRQVGQRSLLPAAETTLRRWEKVMKKFSLVGLVLGALVGVVAAFLAGGWLFWLGLGLAIGLVAGSARRQRGRFQRDTLAAGDWKKGAGQFEKLTY
jgi:hypothetical protein